MKRFTIIFLAALMGATPLFAATETLTTYYPAPSGNYKKLQSGSLQLQATTLNDIQTQYNCSYNSTTGLQPCPAGIVYYDTNAQTIYVSAGTHWRSVNSVCVPVTPCSAQLNCSSDSCGNICGICINNQICSSINAGTPGSCTS